MKIKHNFNIKKLNSANLKLASQLFQPSWRTCKEAHVFIYL